MYLLHHSHSHYFPFLALDLDNSLARLQRAISHRSNGRSHSNKANDEWRMEVIRLRQNQTASQSDQGRGLLSYHSAAISPGCIVGRSISLIIGRTCNDRTIGTHTPNSVHKIIINHHQGSMKHSCTIDSTIQSYRRSSYYNFQSSPLY